MSEDKPYVKIEVDTRWKAHRHKTAQQQAKLLAEVMELLTPFRDRLGGIGLTVTMFVPFETEREPNEAEDCE